MSQLSESSSSLTVTLPAAAEHEWRFSYQFAAPPPYLITRLTLGIGLLAIMIMAVNTAW